MELNYIEIAGVKRPVCFSMRAIGKIQKAFGGLNEMSEGVINRDLGTINTVLEILLDAGQAYCEGAGEECPPPLKCAPADLMGVKDTQAAVEKIFEVMQADSEREIEAHSKN